MQFFLQECIVYDYVCVPNDRRHSCMQNKCILYILTHKCTPIKEKKKSMHAKIQNTQNNYVPHV